MTYVKDSLIYKRRFDLEPPNIECIWIEMQLNHSRLCFGLFYRPPNSDPAYFSGIEDSITLAVDTQIRNITVTGDFNFNVLNEQSFRKITDLCEQFSLYQTITEPTHFTEHSSSLIDIILTSDKRILFIVVLQILFSIKKPIITALFKFSEHTRKSFTRKILSNNQGDFDSLKTKVSNTDWDSLSDPDINIYTRNFTDHLNSLTVECIPNKTVRIRPTDPLGLLLPSGNLYASVNEHIKEPNN